MPKLNNWYIHGSPVPQHLQDDPFAPPEAKKQSFHLSGIVTGHPGFNDGDHITTSTIVNVTPTGNVCTVSGTEYELGNADIEYEKLYSNARERLVAAIQQAVQTSAFGNLT